MGNVGRQQGVENAQEVLHAALRQRLRFKAYILLMVMTYLVPVLQLIGKGLSRKLETAIRFGRLELLDESRLQSNHWLAQKQVKRARL